MWDIASKSRPMLAFERLAMNLVADSARLTADMGAP
jgi:hypothetical protein